LIVLDLNMPLLDGLAVMRAMNALPPEYHAAVILLTADCDRERVIESGKLGVKEYLLKRSFNFSRLLERVTKYAPIAPTAAPAAAPVPAAPTHNGPVRKLFERDECVARAETALRGKTFPGVVMEVVAMAGSSTGDLAEVAAIVARDPMLSARVIQVANSAACSGGRGMVSNIPDAVRKIGYATLRQTATALAVFDAMPGVTGGGFNYIRCWQHSFAVAQLVEHLLSPIEPAQAGLGYVVGLCHDLAEILFQTEFAAEYAQVVKAHAGSGIPIDYLEREMLGVTRDSIIRAIFHKLGLPENVSGPIEAFHDWDRGGAPATDRMTRILRLADRYAIGLLLAPSGHAPLTPITMAECRTAVGNDNPSPPDNLRFRNRVLAMTNAVARLTAEQQRVFVRPPFDPIDIKVWLARDPSFSTFDPMAAALECMAHVDVRDHLMTAGRDWADYDAVVAVAKSTSTPGFNPAKMPKPLTALPDATSRVLWGVSKNENVSGQTGGPAPVTLPLSLDDLDKFLRSCAVVEPKLKSA
jgi:HD-like signal output (HDOD) protein